MAALPDFCVSYTDGREVDVKLGDEPVSRFMIKGLTVTFREPTAPSTRTSNDSLSSTAVPTHEVDAASSHGSQPHFGQSQGAPAAFGQSQGAQRILYTSRLPEERSDEQQRRRLGSGEIHKDRPYTGKASGDSHLDLISLPEDRSDEQEEKQHLSKTEPKEGPWMEKNPRDAQTQTSAVEAESRINASSESLMAGSKRLEVEELAKAQSTLDASIQKTSVRNAKLLDKCRRRKRANMDPFRRAQKVERTHIRNSAARFTAEKENDIKTMRGAIDDLTRAIAEKDIKIAELVEFQANLPISVIEETIEEMNELRRVTKAFEKNQQDTIQQLEAEAAHLTANLHYNQDIHREQITRLLMESDRQLATIGRYQNPKANDDPYVVDITGTNDRLTTEVQNLKDVLEAKERVITTLTKQLMKHGEDMNIHIKDAQRLREETGDLRQEKDGLTTELTRSDEKVKYLQGCLIRLQEAMGAIERLENGTVEEKQIAASDIKGTLGLMVRRQNTAQDELLHLKVKISALQMDLESAHDKEAKLEDELNGTFLAEFCARDILPGILAENETLKTRVAELEAVVDMAHGNIRLSEAEVQFFQITAQVQELRNQLTQREKEFAEYKDHAHEAKRAYEVNISDMGRDYKKKLNEAKQQVGEASGKIDSGNSIQRAEALQAPTAASAAEPHTATDDDDLDYRQFVRVHRGMYGTNAVPSNIFPGVGETGVVVSPVIDALAREHPAFRDIAAQTGDLTFAVPSVKPLTADEVRKRMQQEARNNDTTIEKMSETVSDAQANDAEEIETEKHLDAASAIKNLNDQLKSLTLDFDDKFTSTLLEHFDAILEEAANENIEVEENVGQGGIEVFEASGPDMFPWAMMVNESGFFRDLMLKLSAEVFENDEQQQQQVEVLDTQVEEDDDVSIISLSDSESDEEYLFVTARQGTEEMFGADDDQREFRVSTISFLGSNLVPSSNSESVMEPRISSPSSIPEAEEFEPPPPPAADEARPGLSLQRCSADNILGLDPNEVAVFPDGTRIGLPDFMLAKFHSVVRQAEELERSARTSG